MTIRKTRWWWERLYRSIGGGGFDDNVSLDSQWPGGIHGPVRCRRFGYKVLLNLQDWAERRTYFGGTYYQSELEHLFPLILRRGDQYLDIGANIGMTALMASSLIGQEGKGFAFEPNPETFARLRRHFELNHTSNLEAIPFALADRESEMELVLPRGISGLGSLVASREGTARSFEVRTMTGRPYVERLDPAKPTVIKMDVEGYEVKVLNGIEGILDWPEVIIVAEVNEVLLQRAADSAEVLFELLEKHGFRPLIFDLRTGRFGSEFRITVAGSGRDAIAEGWRDVLFAKPGSNLYRERVAPHSQPTECWNVRSPCKSLPKESHGDSGARLWRSCENFLASRALEKQGVSMIIGHLFSSHSGPVRRSPGGRPPRLGR